MTDSIASVEFTPEETAYFESGGETPIPDSEGAAPQAETPDQPAQPEEQPQPQERDDKGRYVPHQALHAEREEHKKTKAELDAIRQQQAVLNDRWNTILALKEQETKQEEPAQPPDPEKDIFAYSKWQAEQMDALQKELADEKAQAQQRAQIEQQEAAIWNEWENANRSYAAEAPDYADAVKWLSETRVNQLRAFASINPAFASDEGINRQIDAELRSIIIGAREAGVSPAKVVHDLAVSWGFKSATPAEPKLPDQLAAVAKAQEAAKTVGQVPGRAGGDALTPDALAAMKPEEFQRWYADPKNARIFEQMMGG